MKKRILLLLFTCMTLTLAGCKNGQPNNEDLQAQINELKEENEKLKEENKELVEENASVIKNNATLQTDEEENISNQANTKETEISDYIANNIQLLSATVETCEGYDGKKPGLTNVSIKNNGEKNISELIITVYFQDNEGKDIAEDSFQLIGGLWGGDTLKANYSWKMETDKFYPIENLSDEVDITKNRVEITDISFE